MDITTQAITDAKRAAGPGAYLWLDDNGDCILWPSEDASIDDDGQRALARWHLTEDEAAALLATGEVDDVG